MHDPASVGYPVGGGEGGETHNIQRWMTVQMAGVDHHTLKKAWLSVDSLMSVSELLLFLQ